MAPDNDSSYTSDVLCSAEGSGFACIDPSAACVNDDDVTVDIAENCGYIQGIGEAKLTSPILLRCAPAAGVSA